MVGRAANRGVDEVAPELVRLGECEELYELPLLVMSWKELVVLGRTEDPGVLDEVEYELAGSVEDTGS